MAVLRVRDNGIGIAPPMVPRIFELFVQVDHASTKAQGGLGIGLTLVKSLVEMHDGTVEARSEGLGKGSEFVVRLPISAPLLGGERDREVGDQVGQPPAPSGYRLMVVDDNRDAADSLAMRLHGHEVRVAYSGTAALEMTTTYTPDVVFLDIGMSGMHAYEAARRIREQPGLTTVVLAVLTGWGQKEDRRRTAEAGFDHHLVKPPEPTAVEGLLAELERRRGHGSGGRSLPARKTVSGKRPPKAAPFDYTLDCRTTDFRQHSELYRIGKGEQGVLLVEPYNSEILPHWRFKTVAEASKSSVRIYKMFLPYLKADDFPGADMARKFLQMGWTRARRYANHTGGRKYDKATEKELPRTEDAEKAAAAAIFYERYVTAWQHKEYVRQKKRHQEKHEAK